MSTVYDQSKGSFKHVTVRRTKTTKTALKLERWDQRQKHHKTNEQAIKRELKIPICINTLMYNMYVTGLSYSKCTK